MDHEHSSPGRTAGRVAATALVPLAVATSIVLGTAGWFAVGFATMTDCTNSYSCSPAGCPPCTATGRWINAGGLAQWALTGAGVAVLVRARGRAGGVARCDSRLRGRCCCRCRCWPSC